MITMLIIAGGYKKFPFFPGFVDSISLSDMTDFFFTPNIRFFAYLCSINDWKYHLMIFNKKLEDKSFEWILYIILPNIAWNMQWNI